MYVFQSPRSILVNPNVSTSTGCGPTTLNAVVRKTVAAQIDPGRIRRGDLSGAISLVSEEFGY